MSWQKQDKVSGKRFEQGPDEILRAFIYLSTKRERKDVTPTAVKVELDELYDMCALPNKPERVTEVEIIREVASARHGEKTAWTLKNPVWKLPVFDAERAVQEMDAAKRLGYQSPASGSIAATSPSPYAGGGGNGRSAGGKIRAAAPATNPYMAPVAFAPIPAETVRQGNGRSGQHVGDVYFWELSLQLAIMEANREGLYNTLVPMRITGAHNPSDQVAKKFTEAGYRVEPKLMCVDGQGRTHPGRSFVLFHLSWESPL
jgi:hypothetical protein